MAGDKRPFENQIERRKQKRDDVLLIEDEEEEAEEALEPSGEETVSGDVDRERELGDIDYDSFDEAMEDLVPPTLSEERIIDLAAVDQMEGESDCEIIENAQKSYDRSETSMNNSLNTFRENGYLNADNELTPKGEVLRNFTANIVGVEKTDVPDIEERLYSTTLDEFGLEDTEENRDAISGVMNPNAISNIDRLENAATTKRQEIAAEKAGSTLTSLTKGRAYLLEQFERSEEALNGNQVIDNADEKDLLDVTKKTVKSNLSSWVEEGILDHTSEGYQITEKGSEIYENLRDMTTEMDAAVERMNRRKQRISRTQEYLNKSLAPEKDLSEYDNEAEELDAVLEVVDSPSKINLDSYSELSKFRSTELSRQDYEADLPALS